MKWFGKDAGQIRSTKAGKVLDDAKRDVKRGKDEVAAQRNKKNSGGKK